MIEIVALIGGGLYALLGVATAMGIARLPRARRLADAALPRVSLLLSARNEERDLPRCLRALAALDYPHDRLEVILVDDLSTDRTAHILRTAAATAPHFRVYDSANFRTHLEGKSRGIACAASHATGDWLFITDADGAPPAGWLRAMLGRVAPDTGIVTGPFVTIAQGLVGLLERATVLPALSHLFGLGGLGVEVVPMGPNMAIRRDVYESQGGLAAVRFKIAEDVALWQLCQRAGKKVRATLEPEATIAVMPVPSLRHLISQQRRWLVGGFGDGPRGVKWASYGVALFAFAGTSAALLCAAQRRHAGFIALGLLALAQLASMTALRFRLDIRPVWRVWPISIFYTTALFVWLPLTAIAWPRVRWRGEGYDVVYKAD